MSAATSATDVADIDPFAELIAGAEEHAAESELPNFLKMKKPEIVQWVKENVEEEDVPDGFFKASVKEMRAQLMAALAPEDSVTSPATTGFDVNDLIHKTVAEIEGLNGEDAATQAVLDLMDESEFSFFKIGGILSRFKAEGWTGAFDTFPDFVESSFGFKIRKAETLILIYQSLISCGAPWAAAQAVGWSKLGLVAKYLTKDNWQGWFDQIKGVSHATVVQMAKDAGTNKKNGDEKGEAPESTPHKKLSFVIHEDQVENIKDAVDAAKAAMGTEYDGPALHAMALDYLSKPVPTNVSQAAETESDEEGQEAGEVLTEIFTAIRDQADTLQEGVEAIHTALAEVYPELNIEISVGDGDE